MISVPHQGKRDWSLKRKKKFRVWYIRELEEKSSFVSLIHCTPTSLIKLTLMMMCLPVKASLGDWWNPSQKGLPVSHWEYEIGCYLKRDDIYRKEWSSRDRLILGRLASLSLITLPHPLKCVALTQSPFCNVTLNP